jgi:hypothetical protein
MGFESFDASTAVPVDDPSDRVFTDIESTADFLASYCRSVGEAAFRRNEIELRIYRPELYRLANELMALIRDVAPVDGGGR